MTTYAVLSDIHANADALRAALAAVQSGPCDRIIIGGDLLTYGPDVHETLAIVDELAAAGAIVLIGNHDQLYVDLARGDRSYYDGLPGWLRESVDWTVKSLADAPFRERYAWREEYRDGTVSFSHANPFGPKDWRYLNSVEDHRLAAALLKDSGVRLGVFGHTHRQRWFDDGDVVAPLDGDAVEVSGVVVANAGSVGQPRDRSRLGASFARVTVGPVPNVRFERASYAVAPLLERLRATRLSDDTLMKLLAFFDEGPGRGE